MFYSHQLLARKAPLGQIWMAATMHPKINRRNLDKLNIIKICEEILNPSVPMALRLSGILMGGVVIVYERKVKLLYDDVTRLLVEINQAWKVKSVPDPTVLPKRKSQAKHEAITLPDNQEVDLGETEQSMRYSESAPMMGFQQTTYVAMRLDNVDEPLISHNPTEEDPSQHYHQADVANITISEHFDTYQADRDIFNRFERFDMEGDEETHLNFTPPEQTQIPSTLIPSPGVEEEPPKPDEIQEQHPEDHVNQQSDEGKEANQPHQDQQRQVPPRRRQRRAAVSVMDYEQTIIPGHMYQSWLQDASDVVSRRGRKRKHMGTVPTMKIANLMELPSVVLIGGLFANGTGEIHYPPPLLKLSIRSAQPPQNSPSGRASPPQPSSSSPPERIHYQDPEGFPLEEINSGVGSHSLEVPIEKQRTIFADKRMPTDIVTEELGTYFMNNGVTTTEANMIVTPGNSGHEVRSIPSSGSGQDFVSNNSEVNSGRSKKRHYSSSHGGSGLEPVAEENSWRSPNFKLSRLSENGPTPENDLLVETGPTQTQDHPIIIQPIDQLTDSIRMQLKMHFDTPESPKVLSLNQLASGMNRKRAACLFYQTCVLASREFARVEQKVAYGDILVSRGAKM